MPSTDLIDVKTGQGDGLTTDNPAAQRKPGQVLVCGGAEGLRALTAIGIVRQTGEYFYSKKCNATFAVCDLLLESFEHSYRRPIPKLAPRRRPKLSIAPRQHLTQNR
jgi:hypothetical protein